MSLQGCEKQRREVQRWGCSGSDYKADEVDRLGLPGRVGGREPGLSDATLSPVGRRRVANAQQFDGAVPPFFSGDSTSCTIFVDTKRGAVRFFSRRCKTQGF